ncbi:hypothetical protein BT93_H2528 [Corymbia citriodora subsp. variegata]|nr:hypothetical protein BT93_H2528 [Corymbia citriodora subsp. variegata]
MDVPSCAKLVMLALVCTIALQASATEVEAFKGDTCKVKCLLECSVFPDPKACYLTCFKNCIGNAEVQTFESQCDLGCVLSRCFDLSPDAKNAEGCVNSCSTSCKKS